MRSTELVTVGHRALLGGTISQDFQRARRAMTKIILNARALARCIYLRICFTEVKK